MSIPEKEKDYNFLNSQLEYWRVESLSCPQAEAVVQVKNHYAHQGLLAVGAIVASILEELCRLARPGMTTGELDVVAGRLLSERGAEGMARGEYGFPGNVCVSVNDEVVHGVPGARVLGEGDLVKFDLTAGRRGFIADATRMVVLGGGDLVAEGLAEAARRACRVAIESARVGMLLGDLGEIIHGEVGRSGYFVVKELCGHGVGRRVHEAPEVPNFHDTSNGSVLESGMVIAIEPIVSVGGGGICRLDDGWTVVTSDGSLSAHYEETVIVWDAGVEVVTV